MVVVQLRAGLGNQMFQYAAARAVADRLGTSLGLDLRGYRRPKNRAYGLDAFPIRAKLVADADLRGLHAWRGRRWKMTAGVWEQVRTAIWPGALSHLTPVIESGIGYTDQLIHARDDIWMAGYWQSERHFADVADRIRADLTLRDVSADAMAIQRAIQSMACPVAVHVRRGDYANNPVIGEYFGLCGIEYYEAAMQRIHTTFPEATFVFFSDDPDWVSQHFGGVVDLLVSPRGGDSSDAEDIHLMALCRAHIIANSSFSWWGAWLAGSSLVVVPKRWFLKLPVNDIAPSRWERL